VHLRRLRLPLALLATAAIVAPVAWMWQSSRLPDTYDMAEMGYADYGGGHRTGHDHHGGTAVADLVADPERRADVSATLTVATDGGRFTVNGTTPGPVLRATEGDLVEVRLVNRDVADGTTLHWHGVDVPNAMDGVAGVTQDAVGPGEEFTYRFVVEHPGTYWYHAHQVSHEQVRKGLLGALVVDPASPAEGVTDRVALLHRYGSDATLNGETGTSAVDARPGDRVRLRVVNTDNGVQPVWVSGAAYDVLAVDGTDLVGPTPVTDRAYQLTAGARVDLGFEVPAGGVRVEFGGTTAMTFGGDPSGGSVTAQPEEFVDLLHYGSPGEAPGRPAPDTSDPDRTFDYTIGRRLGFLDGRPGRWWTVNGHLFPDIPMYMVEEGDVVVFRIENDSGAAHPMHLHGHHALVLSRDGEEATGSPWWVDSLEVGAGRTFEIALVADNPGIWMDHCHNLPHAAQGLVAHLMYAGVGSSFEIGGTAGNHPE
jgi:FtsP/CotA-like multicopper oxidase with cupredoxin domain